jgi:nitroreductase
MSELPFFRVIETQRAIRRFTPDPVDDATIQRIIEAATRAPSARNLQPWRFVVIRDPDTKATLGAIFDELGEAMYGGGAPDHTPWGEVPVLIAVCSEGAFGGDLSGRMAMDASIFPAVQNLLLAARALGHGTVLTTRWKRREAELRPLLGLPENVQVHAIIPTGWPAVRFGRTTRRPASEVTFRERFGQT